MATVRLSDVVIPAVYLSYQTVNNIESIALSQSGIIVRNDVLDAAANNSNKIVNIPFWKDLDQTIEPNASNDDPDDHAVPNKISTGEMAARNSYLNQGYSEMDLTVEILGSEPMQRIRNRFGIYWTRQFQRRLIAMLKGVYADNLANNSGDMVFQVPTLETGATPGATKVFNRNNFVAAAMTLGDAFDSVQALAVHSVVYAQMVNNDDIDFVADSKGSLTIPTYLQKPVIVDDTMPVRAGTTSGFVYTSILFGGGAVGYGVGTPKAPVALVRDETAGNGGGMETLWERKTWLMHPFGFNWTEGSLTELSPMLADLVLDAHWNRVVPRKAVPLAFLDTNG